MEYQQFVVYSYWNNYERRHGIHARLSNDDEVIRRGMSDFARHRRQASRAAWRSALERAFSAMRLSRRAPRIAA